MARTVLFSREDVAGHINRNFEAAWEMVRPVPIIRIDFGNGNVVTRTLHGNVASYVCAADGQTLDILPGIYQPAVYAAALEQLKGLSDSVRPPTADRQTLLRNYHREKARALANPQPRIAYPRVAAVAPPQGAAAAVAAADRGEAIVERRLEQIVVRPPAATNQPNAGPPRNARPTNPDLAKWQMLA